MLVQNSLLGRKAHQGQKVIKLLIKSVLVKLLQDDKCVRVVAIILKRFFLNAAGDVGTSGKVGRQGDPGPKGQKGQEGRGLSGVNYVRWGRTSCGGDAQVVYTGEKLYVS